MDCMLDIETLSTDRSAVILTFGAVKFDPYTTTEPTQGLYYRLDADEQIASGRHVDDDTLAWWTKQSADIQDEAFSEFDRTSVAVFQADLNRYLVGVQNIWAQGPLFDLILLEDLYKQNKIPVPWWYHQISDSRTLFKLGGDPREKNKDDLHNALADAYNQAIGVQQFVKKYGITKSEY